MVVGEEQRKLGAENLHTLHQGAVRLQQKLQIIVVAIIRVVVVGGVGGSVGGVGGSRRRRRVVFVVVIAAAAVLLRICEREARRMRGPRIRVTKIVRVVVVRDGSVVAVVVVEVAAARVGFVFHHHWLLKTGQDCGPRVPSRARPSFDGPLRGGGGGCGGGSAAAVPRRHGHARQRHGERLVEGFAVEGLGYLPAAAAALAARGSESLVW